MGLVSRPKIGLALGSGAARGLAHIGVIKVMQEARLPIDYISGSSMGAVVAAIWASGVELRYAERLATNLNWEHVVDLRFPKLGLVGGERLLDILRVLTRNKTFEELKTPLAVVATDLETGQRVVFREGSVAEAVRASAAIPGIFVPTQYQGRTLVDGGVVDRVPIDCLREMGANVVIAVDVGLANLKNDIRNIFDVIIQTIEIMQHELTSIRQSTADVTIAPSLNGISGTRLDLGKQIVERGEQAAREALPQIMRALAAWEEGRALAMKK